MAQIQDSRGAFPVPRQKLLFYPNELRLDTLSTKHTQIDWQRLIAKLEMVLDTLDTMPAYLLKPEILGLLEAEKHPTYRLILDLIWSTGARISEVLVLTPSHFVDDGYDFMVMLRTLKQRPGRPTKVLTADGGHFFDEVEFH